MRFIVSSSILLKGLQQINGVISTNNILSVLEDYLFELSGNTLTITATDLETMMRVNIEVNEATDDGSICIPSKIITEYLKNLPEQPVNFNINEKDLSIEISGDRGKYKIMGEVADDFPKEPEATDATSFSMPSIALLESINNTLFAVSNDTLRPAMTGVFMQMQEGAVNFVSTDAHRLVRYRREDINCPQEAGLIIPKKPLQQLKANLAADESQVELSYNEHHLFVKNDKLSMSCRLVDARFPDYAAVIPQNNPFLLTVNRSELLSALKRVSIFSSKSTSQILLHINGNSLNISAQDIDFSYEGLERLSCQYNGEEMKIAFNAKLMIEMLSNMEGEDILIELSTANRAGIFRPSENAEKEELMMLLMPLMVGVD